MEIEHCHDATNYIEKNRFFFYAKCDAFQNFWGEHWFKVSIYMVFNNETMFIPKKLNQFDHLLKTIINQEYN